jgi:lipoprotein-anchoring transpeptidase ErfK/SrfK
MALVALVVAGCAKDRATQALERQRAAAFGVASASVSASPTPRPIPEWEWEGGGSGAKKIVIDLGEQKAMFYKGGQEIGWADISSGRAGMGTPAGTYRVLEKDIDHRSSLYGDFVDSNGDVVRRDVNMRIHSPGPGQRYRGASMRYFLRFHGGYGMHAGYLPGYPASHGCVRLPHAAAVRFYEEADYGTPVIVRH